MVILEDFVFGHVLVIGNGFDLDLGLPTSYSQFLASDEFVALTAKHNKLAQYLEKKHLVQNWVDIENELIIASKTNAADPLRNKPSDYLEEYKALREALVQYIKKLEYKNLNEHSAAYCAFHKVCDRDSVCIVNFNYTETISVLLRYRFPDATHIQIHGAAANGKIVFGVHDQADIKNEHVFLRKAVSSALYKKHFAGEFMRNASESVSIFGHSLGNTDFTQFLPFFDLDQHEKSSKLDVYYHSESSYYDLYGNIDLLTNNQLQRFSRQHEFKMIGPKMSGV